MPGTERQTFLLRAAAVAMVALAAAAAQAAQTISINESDTAVVRVSARDQTRIRAEHGRLLDVIGDVYDAQKNPAGRVMVLKDEADGEFYVKFVGSDTSPLKLDVKSDRGTVGLLLQPALIVSDTLVLRIQADEQRRSATATASRSPARSSAHVRAIKALTLAMVSPSSAPDVEVQRLPLGGEVLALWKDVHFVLKSRHLVQGLTGEAYELTNASDQPRLIDERELFRPGVLAVSLQDLSLAPGQTTRVWIVRVAGMAE